MRPEKQKSTICIKLGDPFFEEVFNTTFTGVSVEIAGHFMHINASEFLRILRKEADLRWGKITEEMEEIENAAEKK